MTVAGDPFLRIQEPALTVDLPEGLPQGILPPGPVTPVTLEILPGQQFYKPGSGLLHYRFDPDDPYSTEAITHLGGDLYEAKIPNTRPGDEPQFYFTVEGDGGARVHLPFEAPDQVYSFEVVMELTRRRAVFPSGTGSEKSILPCRN